MCKYPWIETSDLLARKKPKFGIYNDPADVAVFEWLWEDRPSARTLGTEILDLADDIAYAVHDFEDGVWAGLIPLHALIAGDEPELSALSAMALRRDAERPAGDRLFEDKRLINEALDQLLEPLSREIKSLGELKLEANSKIWAQRPFDRQKDSRAHLKNYCADLIGEFIDCATVDDRFSELDVAAQRRLNLLTAMAWQWMIERPDLETKRFAQRGVVHDLFNGYWERPEMLPEHLRQDWLDVANAGKEAGLDAESTTWPEKARLICDHIASMTDLYAVGVHTEMYQARQSLALQM